MHAIDGTMNWPEPNSHRQRRDAPMPNPSPALPREGAYSPPLGEVGRGSLTKLSMKMAMNIAVTTKSSPCRYCVMASPQ